MHPSTLDQWIITILPFLLCKHSITFHLVLKSIGMIRPFEIFESPSLKFEKFPLYKPFPTFMILLVNIFCLFFWYFELSSENPSLSLLKQVCEHFGKALRYLFDCQLVFWSWMLVSEDMLLQSWQNSILTRCGSNEHKIKSWWKDRRSPSSRQQQRFNKRIEEFTFIYRSL